MVEVIGVKCRHCEEIILDEATSGMLMALGGLAAITVPLLFNGGIHYLTCKKPKSN